MEKEKQILSFLIDNREYFVFSNNKYSKNNKMIVHVAYRELNNNDKIFYNVKGQEQLNFIYNILEQLNIKLTNKIDFGEITYNNQKYKMFFDQLKQTREFYKIDNKVLTSITTKEREYLDYKYNYVNDYLSLDKEHKSDKKPFNLSNVLKKIKVVVNKKTITMLVYVTIYIAMINAGFEIVELIEGKNDTYQSFASVKFEGNNQIEILDETGNTNITESILSLISKSENMSKEEKALFYSFEKFYNDNSRFLDVKLLEKVIPSLKIEYKTDESTNVLGAYFNNANKIKIYTVDKYDGTDSTNHILTHEYFHALSYSGLVRNNNLGYALNEGITELLNFEYKNLRNYEYTEEVNYVRILCELIGKDQILKAYFSGDLQHIIDALCEINNDENKAMRLIKSMDDEWRIRYDNTTEKTVDEKKNSLENKKEIMKLIIEYFELKNEHQIEDNQLMCAYIDKILYTNLSNCTYYNGDNISSIVIEKYCFNEDLINSQTNALITYNFTTPVNISSNSLEEETNCSEESLLTNLDESRKHLMIGDDNISQYTKIIVLEPNLESAFTR